MESLAGFGFWLVGGGLSVVLSVFSALALPVWNFSFITSQDFSALQPVINAASWAIDWNAITVAFGVAVASLVSYTVAVFYWRAIGSQFLSGSAVQIWTQLAGGNVFDVLKNIVLGFLGLAG